MSKRQPDLDEWIWAVRDTCFKVKPGEVIGIIGRNRAGKCTALEILSDITRPTEGVEQAVRDAGLQAVLTVDPGYVRPGQAPYRVSRIEVMRGDVGWSLWWKITFPRDPLRLSKAH